MKAAELCQVVVKRPRLTAIRMCSAEEELSFKELQEQLRMPKEDLQRVLHSLSCAKYKVLTCSTHACTCHFVPPHVSPTLPAAPAAVGTRELA
jgi:hypothetical protein